MKDNIRAVRLDGSSMRPLFRAGDVVLLSAADRLSPFGGLAPGDCAVYDYEGRTLLHRVVKTDAAGVWLADDAGRIATHMAPWSAVRGRVLSGKLFAGGLPGFLYSRCRSLLLRSLRALTAAR